MLIDNDSKPKETIYYIAIEILQKIKKKERVKIALVEEVYEELDDKYPAFKYELALNFLFLIEKIRIEEGDLVYVS